MRLYLVALWSLQVLMALMTIGGQSFDEASRVFKNYVQDDWKDPNEMFKRNDDQKGVRTGKAEAGTGDQTVGIPSNDAESRPREEYNYGKVESFAPDRAEGNCGVNIRTPVSSSIPYFKQLVNSLKSRLEGSAAAGSKQICFIFSEHELDRLNKLLVDPDASEKEVLDNVLDSLQASKAPDSLSEVEQPWRLVATVCATLTASLAVYFGWSQLPRINWYRFGVTLFFLCFLVSIPWEWQRMFKEALAKKASASMKDVPESCNPKSTWAAMKMWLREQVSFQEDPCVIYHQAILVDPFWEVTPFQAFTSCASRFFLHPMELFAEAAGKAMKLFFSNIPTPLIIPVFVFAFVLLIVCIMSFFGFEISTPLLRIGVRPTQVVYDMNYRRLDAKNEMLRMRVMQLESEKELMLKERVEEIGDSSQWGSDLQRCAHDRGMLRKSLKPERGASEPSSSSLLPESAMRGAKPLKKVRWSIPTIEPSDEERALVPQLFDICKAGQSDGPNRDLQPEGSRHLGSVSAHGCASPPTISDASRALAAREVSDSSDVEDFSSESASARLSEQAIAIVDHADAVTTMPMSATSTAVQDVNDDTVSDAACSGRATENGFVFVDAGTHAR